jgi:hypothetical protein
MSELKVVPLQPQSERDAKKVQLAMESLVAKHTAGDVSELIYVVIDAKGNYEYLISGNMSFSHLALSIAYLQRDLQELISRSGDRAPPEQIG